MLQKHIIRNIVKSAIDEDVGAVDVTTTAALTGVEIGKALALASFGDVLQCQLLWAIRAG